MKWLARSSVPILTNLFADPSPSIHRPISVLSAEMIKLQLKMKPWSTGREPITMNGTAIHVSGHRIWMWHKQIRFLHWLETGLWLPKVSFRFYCFCTIRWWVLFTLEQVRMIKLQLAPLASLLQNVAVNPESFTLKKPPDTNWSEVIRPGYLVTEMEVSSKTVPADANPTIDASDSIWITTGMNVNPWRPHPKITCSIYVHHPAYPTLKGFAWMAGHAALYGLLNGSLTRNCEPTFVTPSGTWPKPNVKICVLGKTGLSAEVQVMIICSRSVIWVWMIGIPVRSHLWLNKAQITWKINVQAKNRDAITLNNCGISTSFIPIKSSKMPSVTPNAGQLVLRKATFSVALTLLGVPVVQELLNVFWVGIQHFRLEEMPSKLRVELCILKRIALLNEDRIVHLVLLLDLR